jgi:hypothetical protein
MEKFSVTAKLASPLVMGGGYFTLDALLAGLIFEKTGDVETAHSTIPIACTDGLFHASAAQFEPWSKDKITFVANMRAKHSLNPDLILKNKNGEIHHRLGLTRRRDFGAVLNKYHQFSAEEIVWYAEGDPGAVERLIEDIKFIGKRRASGFGEISSWEVLDNEELDGIIGYVNEPLRPVPIDMFRGDPSSLKVDATWRPAYWQLENRAICYAPELMA